MSSVSRIPAVSTSLGNAVDVDVFLDNITGGSFDIGNNGFFFAKKIIEEAGLADVWSTDDSSRDPFTQDLTATGSLEEVGQEGFKFSGLFTDDFSGCFFDIIVLRIVDIDFDLGQVLRTLGACCRSDQTGTIELFHSDVHSLIGLGAIMSHDGFGPLNRPDRSERPAW